MHVPTKPEGVLANGVLESIVVFVFPDVGCVRHWPSSLLLSCGLQPCCWIDGSNFAQQRQTHIVHRLLLEDVSRAVPLLRLSPNRYLSIINT